MIRVEVQDQAVQALLHRLSQSVKNLQPAMGEIGTTLVDHVRLGFKGGTDPWGSKWKSIGQAAIMGRLKHRKNSFLKSGKISKPGQNYLTGGVQPLLDTGNLRSSITYRATGNSVEVGTNVKYASTHQIGAKQGAFGRTRRNSPIPWGNIPARPFMPIRNGKADLPAGWQAEIVGILQRRIAEAVQ